MNKIEISVVILVLVIVGALMLPALQKQKARSCSPTCSYNLNRLGLASALYETDNRGACPGPQPLGIYTPSISWDRPLAIQMGLKLGNIGMYEPISHLTQSPTGPAARMFTEFACPADPLGKGARAIPETPGSLADGMASGTGICRSYVMNLGSGNLVAGIDDGIVPVAAAIPLEKVESAVGTVYLIESQGYATVFGQRSIANDTYLTCDRETGLMSPKGAISDSPAHKFKSIPRANAIMYDGHVELLDQVTISADGGKIMQYHKQAEQPGPSGRDTAARP